MQEKVLILDFGVIHAAHRQACPEQKFIANFTYNAWLHHLATLNSDP
jgi:hypothetical protein